MQAIIVSVNSILIIMGFVCICMSTYKFEKNISSSIKRIVLPGAMLGGVISPVIFAPISLLNLITGVLLGILTAEVIAIF